MKRFLKTTVSGLLFSTGISLLLIGCTAPDANSTGNIELKNEDDSLSYAVSMFISERMPAMMAKEGIDSTTVDDFIRGMRTAFPAEDTPESRAFASGVFAAIEAAEMIDKINASIYPDEKEKSIDRKLFLEGMVAVAAADTEIMNTSTAADYYNQRIFRARSEQFIAGNSKRPGVVTLDSGVQYRIERLGKGAKATYNGRVTCIYKGMYPNGAVFASSRGEAVELKPGELVPGLAEVLMSLPEGTRCMAYIPWNMAYGEKGGDGVPPYSALVYDLEIVSAK
jgi:FKBP-type peptidyl-prolyl cis-trans isomerase FklB